jgi:hypothetical protein
MKLENATDRAAAFLPNSSPTSARHMLGCVVAREILRIEADGSTTPLADPRWPVGPEAAPTPLGGFPGDRPFYAGGVGVLLGGKVFAPGGVPTTRLDVELEIGRTFRRRITVLGDRTWQRAADPAGGVAPVVVPGPAKTFTVMRLDASRSYGGVARGPQGMKVPHQANALGLGFHLDEDEAVGKPLPNLEHPDRLLARWNDRPTPVGLGYVAADSSLHAVSSVARKEDGSFTGADLLPSMFDHGHPDMVIEPAKAPVAGDVIRLSHGRRGGEDLVVRLPDRAMHVFVQLEKRGWSLPLVLDQIGIGAGEDRLMLGWRVVYEYTLVKGERRWVTLREGPAPRTTPDGYRKPLIDEWDGDWWRRNRRAQGSPGPSSE